MKDTQQQFLTLLGNLPARLTSEQAAWSLGCQAHDVPILVAAKLLKPLGNPAANGVKFFAACDVREMLNDKSLLARMTNTISHHWQKKNAGKKKSGQNEVNVSFSPVAGNEAVHG